MELSWSETNPDFTFCFKQTVLIWVPLGYLWLFAMLDLKRRSKSRLSDIPWSFLNMSRLVFSALLIILSIVDLSMMFAIAEPEEIHDVQYVSVGIKIASFVSRETSRAIKSFLWLINWFFGRYSWHLFSCITNKRVTERPYICLYSGCHLLCVPFPIYSSK